MFDIAALEGVLLLSLSLSVSHSSPGETTSQYTIRIELLIWRQILGDGEECTVFDHFAHECAQILGIIDTRMGASLEGQPNMGEGITEVTRTIFVPLPVDCTDIDPLIKIGSLAHPLARALLVQTDAKVPVCPGDKRTVAQYVRLVCLGQQQVAGAQLLAQPLVEHHQCRLQGHSRVYSLLLYPGQLCAVAAQTRRFNWHDIFVELGLDLARLQIDQHGREFCKMIKV